MVITGGLFLVRREDSVVGEEVQKTMVHQVEEEGTMGEEAAIMNSKPEGEGVHSAEVRIVLV